MFEKTIKTIQKQNEQKKKTAASVNDEGFVQIGKKGKYMHRESDNFESLCK